MDIQTVDISTLKKYPNNPRKGNIQVIADSLATNGQYKTITVNKRNNEILAGNHTYEAAKSLGWTELTVTFVDVDDETAAKIVLLDNRTADMGEYENEALIKLLEELEDLEHTGYSDDDLDDLLALYEEVSTPELKGGMAVTSVAVENDGENVIRKKTLEELAERYNDRATRMLILDYQNDIYVWIVEKLTAIRAEHDLVSNTEAVIKLIEDYTGETCPEV